MSNWNRKCEELRIKKLVVNWLLFPWKMENSSTCSFNDALYVTADDGLKPVTTTLTSSETTSSYYSAPTHSESTFLEEGRDSGLSSSSPGDFVLESQVDVDLLEETLGDIYDEDNVRITPNEGKICPTIKNETLFDEVNSTPVPNSFIMVPVANLDSNREIETTADTYHHNELHLSSERKTSKISKASDTVSNYTFDGEYIESDMFEQPSMEYDLSWQPRAESSPVKKEAREKILIRELSFDEYQDVKGVDLMAPVFLAVTNEDDDNVFDMKRKAKSIEDLCSTITYPLGKIQLK